MKRGTDRKFYVFSKISLGLMFQLHLVNGSGHGVVTFEWPAVSHDLNDIANLWGVLALKVYARGKGPYANKFQLSAAVSIFWKILKIDIEKYRKLSEEHKTKPRKQFYVATNSAYLAEILTRTG